ncbi:MAG: hypothetical protein PHW72_01440, partial [Candidatus Pacebacteria bacterium]|nr:hypothetical protein [Candidatus Paceibacterota bacterium]
SDLVGAQPSATVYNLLVSEKLIEGKKIDVHKKAKKKEGEAAAPAGGTAPAPASPIEQKPAEPKTEAPQSAPEVPKAE